MGLDSGISVFIRTHRITAVFESVSIYPVQFSGFDLIYLMNRVQGNMNVDRPVIGKEIIYAASAYREIYCPDVPGNLSVKNHPANSFNIFIRLLS
jgi:hypothetical protein